MVCTDSEKVELYSDRIRQSPIQKSLSFALDGVGRLIAAPFVLSRIAINAYRSARDNYAEMCQKIQTEHENRLNPPIEHTKNHDRIFDQSSAINPVTGLPRYLN
jgi:hypothetical protein